MKRPNVLAVAHIPIDPDYPNGFSYRLHAFFKSLAQRVDLDLLILQGIWDDQTPAEKMVSKDIPCRKIYIETARDRPQPRRPTKGIWARTSAIAHHFLSRTPIPPAYQAPECLAEILKSSRPDLIIFFFHHMAALVPYFPADIPCLFILEEGDERNALTNAVAAESKVPPLYKRLWRRIYWWPRVLRFWALYRQLGQRGHVLAISEKEKLWFSKSVPPSRITVIPNALDCIHYSPRPPTEEFDIGIFGVFRHRRNYEPARQIFDELTRQAGRPLRWLFVGQEPHEMIRSLASDLVKIECDVPDTRPYYAKVKLVIVPATLGAGAKSTVLKAWAMARPILTTPHGAAGLPARSGQNLQIARDTRAMAREALRLLDKPDERVRLAENGRRTVEQERNLKHYSEEFSDLCLRLIEQRPT